MKRAVLGVERPTRLLERQWPWLVIALLGSVALGLIAFSLVSGAADIDPAEGGRNLRGYTTAGLSLGILALVLALLTFAYSLRKRALQESMPLGKGTMMTWMWLHVYLGVLAVVAAVAHAGFGLMSGGVSTGKLLFFVIALLAVSGVAWRLAYRIVPPIAAPQVGNYSQVGALKRATEQLTEAEKIAAGKSPEFHSIKAWMLAAERSAAEVHHAAGTLRPEERADLVEVHTHIASRNRALTRQKLQEHYTSLLQGWRKLHVPLTLAFVVLLVAHVVGAFDLPARVTPVGIATRGPLSGFAPSDDCASCHKTIYDQWSGSMHAHALTSPLMIAQANQDAKVTLLGAANPDPLQICINCHSPVGAFETRQITLPLDDETRFHEGVSCTSCHQYGGKNPAPGSAGLTGWQKELERGHTYFGPFVDAVGNGYHQSDDTPLWKTPDKLCIGCHNVNYDINGDGKIVKGEDLVLQQTHDEWNDYVATGGKDTCVSCHMPLLHGVTRAADDARIPLDQDFLAPDRAVHDHSFVGVDYPLDSAPEAEVQRALRSKLLKDAARLQIDEGSLAVNGNEMVFKVSVTNKACGHNLPTGFAFARQMWLEVKISDKSGTFFTSGVLAKPGDDLCDSATLDDHGHPPRSHVVGCDKTDPELVNFQQRLVDHVEIARSKQGERLKNDRGEFILAETEKGKETPLQALTAGVVARVRPADGQPLGTIAPNATRTVAYKAPLPDRFVGEANVSVRLLFRNLPPYMLRELAPGQGEGEPPLVPLIKNIETVEMAAAKATLNLRGR